MQLLLPNQRPGTDCISDTFRMKSGQDRLTTLRIFRSSLFPSSLLFTVAVLDSKSLSLFCAISNSEFFSSKFLLVVSMVEEIQDTDLSISSFKPSSRSSSVVASRLASMIVSICLSATVTNLLKCSLICRVLALSSMPIPESGVETSSLCNEEPGLTRSSRDLGGGWPYSPHFRPCAVQLWQKVPTPFLAQGIHQVKELSRSGKTVPHRVHFTQGVSRRFEPVRGDLSLHCGLSVCLRDW